MPARLTVASAILLLAGLAAVRAAPVDESALRYYAATRQEARVEAEIRRLQALSPEWRVPDDLALEEVGRADEAPLWALFADDRLDELSAEITARGRREPGWRPSAGLVLKLDRKRTRVAILREVAAGHWEDAARRVDVAKADPRDPELVWAMAEALGRVRREGDALALLRRVLAASRDPAARRATVLKGLALLSLERAEQLIADGGRDAEGASEWRPIALDIARARIAGYLRRGGGPLVAPAEVAAFGDAVRSAKDEGGAALLGWYAFRRGEAEPALEWFKLAMAGGGDAITAHGLAHALRRLGFVRDAEDVAYAWREPLVQNTILFTDLMEAQLTAARPIAVEPERLERFARVVTETQSGEGAQALAWYAYNLCQLDVALTWFERAAAWFPKEATVLGYAVTLRRLGREREFVQLVNRYDGLFPRVVGLVFADESVRERPTCGGDAVGPVRPAPAREAEAVRPVVPRPNAGDRQASAHRLRRAAFPVAVSSENPRRVVEGRAVALDEAASRAARPPLVARRVLGVTAMPYEPLGIGLSPAYDGATAAAATGAPELPAPRGTLWAEREVEQSRPVPHRALASGARFPSDLLTPSREATAQERLP